MFGCFYFINFSHRYAHFEKIWYDGTRRSWGSFVHFQALKYFGKSKTRIFLFIASEPFISP